MATEWMIKGPALGNCNCDYNCPCQFGMPEPTHDSCHGLGAGWIDEGYYGDVDLAGVKWVMLYMWPGAIHEGNGSQQVIVDESASEAQRAGIEAIVTGRDTEPFATHFNVFNSTMSTVHPTLFAPISMEIDVDARTGRVSIPGVLDISGEPIRDAVSGEASRIRIDLPDGFEYEIAEIGTASSKVTAAVKFELKDTYGQFNLLHMTGKGVVRNRAA